MVWVDLYSLAGFLNNAMKSHCYLGAGMHLAGAMPLRRDDEFGLAVANAYTRLGAERAIEVTRYAKLCDGVTLQPSMQWILNPGGNATASTIRVALLRFELYL